MSGVVSLSQAVAALEVVRLHSDAMVICVCDITSLYPFTYVVVGLVVVVECIELYTT